MTLSTYVHFTFRRSCCSLTSFCTRARIYVDGCMSIDICTYPVSRFVFDIDDVDIIDVELF